MASFSLQMTNGVNPKSSEMLSDMHDKLSQAVKLYDQILTQQVAQPRWRTAATSPTPYQQQQSLGTNYSHWAPQVHANPTGYQAPPETPLSPHLAYTSPPPTDAQSTQWNQPQYQYQPHQISPEIVASQTSVPPSQYAQPLQYQHFGSTPSMSQNVTPLHNQLQAVSVQSKPSLVPAAPVSLAQSSPPTQYQPPILQAPVSEPPVAPTLARANSVSHTSATPVPHIARNNTMASHAHTQQYQQRQYQVPPQQQHQQQQQQQQSYQIASPPAPPSLPQFPVVPTAAPQPTFPIYGSTIPSGFEERKEALLIDL